MIEGVALSPDAIEQALLHGGPGARWGVLTYVLAPVLGGIHGFAAAALSLPVRSDAGRARVGDGTYLLRGAGLGVLNLVFVVLAWELLPHVAMDAALSVGATVPWVLAQAVALVPLWAVVAVATRVTDRQAAALSASLRGSVQYFGGLLVIVVVAALSSL